MSSCSIAQSRPVAFRLALVVAVSLFNLLPGSPDSRAAGQILAEGSTTLQPVVQRIAREFMKDHPGGRVAVVGGGSGEGIDALLDGEVDIANSSRFIDEEEVNRAVRNGIYPVPFRIAVDCIIPIIHKSNRIRDLGRQQLRRIYRGEIGNWKELGGPDRPIEVFSRDRDSGTYGVWHDVIMGGEEVAAGAIRAGTTAEVVKGVSASPGAIGYISLGQLSASIKPVRVDGVMGSLYSVRNGSYLLSRPLFMFTRGWPEGRVLQFINYTLNPDRGQSIVQKMGLIPVHSNSNY